MTLKPCPFCGCEDHLKHYVTAASGGGMRGVVVCKSCGARLEAYNRDYRILLNAGYSYDDATTHQRGLVSDAVADKWNNRPEPACALKYNIMYRCHVCDSCGERFDMPMYTSVTDNNEFLLKPIMYCPHCGKKVTRND